MREQRGLAYSVGLGLDAPEHSGLVSGDHADARRPGRCGHCSSIRQEIARFAKDGPTADELANAKAYLIGSYPLRFVTSAQASPISSSGSSSTDAASIMSTAATA